MRQMKEPVLAPPNGQAMQAVNFLRPKLLRRGDNLDVLREMPSESVDLIYLDPPFFSNRTYEVIWGDEAEVRSFLDRWEGGIEVYTAWMRERCEQMHRVLAPTGSLYLHCDWHASHYLKAMLDDIFGYRQFQNEVIWYYRGAGVSKRRWGRRHDNLLFYTKGDEWTFNVDPVRVEYAAATQERFKHAVGNVRKGGDFGPQQLNPKGKHPDDVWQISILAPSARARLGYPTQKPEALLQNVVLASSNEGDTVLDPFCGCGTTLSVAEQYKRNWIGIDISPTAIDICDVRLGLLGAAPAKMGMPATMDDLRAMSPYEFQNWVCHQVNATPSPKMSGDRGIDGRMIVSNDPVQVKQTQVGRPDVDAFETAIKRAKHERGVLVGLSFSRDAREEIARVKRAEGIQIDFFRAEEILATAPTDRIVQRVRAGQQLSLEDFLPRAPKDKPDAEELIGSELEARRQRRRRAS
jgi:DNA modification methylase